VGPSCHSKQATVWGAELRIQAALSSIDGREVVFKTDLAQILTSALDALPGRISVNHVSLSAAESLISAEVMVRPATVSYGRRLRNDRTSEEVLDMLEEKLQSDAAVGPGGLAAKVCSLAWNDDRTSDCTVGLKLRGKVPPLVHFHGPHSDAQAKETHESHTKIIFGAVLLTAAGFSCGILLLLARCLRKHASRKAEGRTQMNEVVCEDPQAAKDADTGSMKQQKEQDLDDTASTATPHSVEETSASVELSMSTDGLDVERRGTSV